MQDGFRWLRSIHVTNLDPFLVSKEKVVDSFLSHFKGDISVVEGNRGFSTAWTLKDRSVSAELAKLLRAPVILIVGLHQDDEDNSGCSPGIHAFSTRMSQIKGIVLNPDSWEPP